MLEARLPALNTTLADQTQAGYQLGHTLAIAQMVVGKLSQHQPFLDVDLEL